MQHIVYIGFGSNLGDRISHCQKALDCVESSKGSELSRISSFYLTEPVGFKEQGWFVNGVAEVLTQLSSAGFLKLLHDIEHKMGRKRTIRWGPRTIDVDILFFDDEIIREKDLIVPHPRMHERRFVLEPLADIIPGKIHPVLGKTVSELLNLLPEGTEKVKKIQRKQSESF